VFEAPDIYGQTVVLEEKLSNELPPLAVEPPEQSDDG